MAKKIPMVIKREWLKNYEEGITQEAIASKNRRDVRTIKKAIEDARRERNINRAYEEMLKEALHGHQQDLMLLLKQLKELFVPFFTFKEIPYEGFESEYFTIPGGKAYYEILPEVKVTAINLDIEAQPLWSLLKEHLKQDPFKKSFDKWKQDLSIMLESLMELKQKMVKLLKAETGYEVKRANESGAFILDTGVDHLFGYVCMHELGTLGVRYVADNIHAEPETGQVKYGEGTTLALCKGEEEKCKNKIITVVEKLFVAEETKAYLITRQIHKESIETIRGNIDEIIMTRIVPGHCKVCQRLGL